MKILSDLIRNAEGGGGAAAPAAAPTATPPAAPAVAPGAGDGAPPAAPAASSTPPAAAADYWPEGLDPSLKGADLNGTFDNFAKALKGYRDRDAQRGVPETAEGYFNLEPLKGKLEIADAQKPYFDMLSQDPAFGAMAKTLHKHGVGQMAALEAYRDGLTAMGEAGLLEPLIDAKAERAALLPEGFAGKSQAEQDQAIDRRMQENLDFLNLAKTNMGLDPKAAEYAEMMLGDSARGHTFFEWIKGKVQGGGTAPQNIGGGGQGVTRESLREEMRQLEANKSDPNYRQKRADLDAKYQKFFG